MSIRAVTLVSEWTWIVNGQSCTLVPKRGDTVFSLASRAVALTGNFQWWSPDTWEVRSWAGGILRWEWSWRTAASRMRRTEAVQRRCVWLNMRAGAGS